MQCRCASASPRCSYTWREAAMHRAATKGPMRILDVAPGRIGSKSRGLLITGIGNDFEAILPMLFESNADLDSVDGPCSRLSITMQVEGVRAHLFD